jgi:ACS family glucarate transporter-like MFS transporter
MTVPEAQVVPDEAAVRDAVGLDAAPSLKDSSQRWWLLALLFTAMLIAYAHRGALNVAAPFMSDDLHLSKTSIGLLLSAFSWFYSFMQIPAGWLVDRFGVRVLFGVHLLVLLRRQVWPRVRLSSVCA